MLSGTSDGQAQGATLPTRRHPSSAQAPLAEATPCIGTTRVPRGLHCPTLPSGPIQRRHRPSVRRGLQRQPSWQRSVRARCRRGSTRRLVASSPRPDSSQARDHRRETRPRPAARGTERRRGLDGRSGERQVVPMPSLPRRRHRPTGERGRAARRAGARVRGSVAERRTRRRPARRSAVPRRSARARDDDQPRCRRGAQRCPGPGSDALRRRVAANERRRRTPSPQRESRSPRAS